MRKAVRAIIIKDDKLLVMNRNKFGKVYDTLPGGNVEIGETLEQALYREVQEETQVEFKNHRHVITEHAGDPYGDQFVFLCEYVSGEPTLMPGSEEEHINRLGQNMYKPMWLSLHSLKDAPFLSETLKQHILEYHLKGWPANVVEIS